MKSFDDMVLHFLKDMYYAERAIQKALPELASAAQNDGFKKALLEHVEQTKENAQCLQEAFAALGKTAEAMTCEAMVGLMQEADDVIKGSGVGPVRDAALLACVQAIKHYVIARYSTLVAWLEAIGQKEAASLLQQCLEEEQVADARLNEVVRREINQSLVRG
jgi:ferritin-like metal-binding protein YciE